MVRPFKEIIMAWKNENGEYVTSGGQNFGDNQQYAEAYEESMKNAGKIGDSGSSTPSSKSGGSIYDDPNYNPGKLQFDQTTPLLTEKQLLQGEANRIKTESEQAHVERLFNIAADYRKRGDLDNALTAILEALKTAGQYSSTAIKVNDCQGDIGEIYELKGNIYEALSYYGREIKNIETLISSAEYGNFYLLKGKQHSAGELKRILAPKIKHWEKLTGKKYKKDVSIEEHEKAYGALVNQGLAAYNAKDYAKAFELWKKAADAGNADAMNNVGFCYENGQGVPQDKAKALEWYKRLEAVDSERGKKAIANLQKPSNQSSALVDQGLASFNAKDYAKAVELWKKAADMGNEVATRNLGECYRCGFGVAVDNNKAKEFLKKAASMGDEPAKGVLAKQGW
jgi:TPR repeat protein